MYNLRKEFDWCGYKWETCMEGGRPIHPDMPWMYIDQCCCFSSLCDNTTYVLTIDHYPIELEWWDKNWENKVKYNPTIACGLMKTIETIPVNSSIECEVRMPYGANIWPAFWLTACDNWPPEIDVFEGYTNSKGSYMDKLKFHCKWPFLYREVRIESNVHYTDDSGTHRQVSPEGDKKDMFNLPLESEWNHFRVEWRENSIKFFINNKLHRIVDNKEVLNKMKTKGMWVIFNVFVSDNFDTNRDGDILIYYNGMHIRNFKVNKL